jgi:hypothetical protein
MLFADSTGIGLITDPIGAILLAQRPNDQLSILLIVMLFYLLLIF